MKKRKREPDDGECGNLVIFLLFYVYILAFLFIALSGTEGSLE